MKGLHEGRKKGEGEERTKGGGIGGANRSSGSYHTLGTDVTQQKQQFKERGISSVRTFSSVLLSYALMSNVSQKGTVL